MRHRNRELRGRLTAALALAVLSPAPGSRAEEGLSFEDNRIHPGKLDYKQSHEANETDLFNLFFWSPTFKGGAGWIEDRDHAFAGGFLRPLEGHKDLGELVIGFQYGDQAGSERYEAQAEYRLPFGLGLGGGLVENRELAPDIRFAKLSFRDTVRSWSYIVSVQAQDALDETRPGGYLAWYDDRFMLTAGTDGEQWRTAFGYVAAGETRFRPTGEILYIDQTIGTAEQPRVVFANFTLGFRGGFLSHPARLGRAMGPTGLEFGNPLGFLAPGTWNRMLDVWELGELADARLLLTAPPGQEAVWVFEALAFPFQLLDADAEAPWRWIFGGFSVDHQIAETVTGLMGGVTATLGFLDVNAEVEVDIDTGDLELNLGLIDRF